MRSICLQTSENACTGAKVSVLYSLLAIHGTHSPINTTTFTHIQPTSNPLHCRLLQTMAKLIILVALLVLATSMVEASIYRTTTVTTHETIDSSDRMSRKCRMEMMQASMDSCKEFMRSGRMTMLRTTLRDEEQEQQQPLQECCSNLSNVSRDCRCPIVAEMMQDMQQESSGEQGREQQQQEMVTRAERLTEMCGLRPQRCHIRQQPSFF